MDLSDIEKYIQKRLQNQTDQEDAESPDFVRQNLHRFLLSTLSRKKSFGHFEFQEQLGIGGFGIVLLARDTRSDSKVALKLPLPQVLLSPKAKSMFERDGRTGLMLDHPGIVKVHKFGEIDGIPYIASEYVEGPTLERWLKKRGDSIPAVEAAEIVSLIADALQHAHAKGVIHRDLKPSNILLKHVDHDESDGSVRPMITDFGLARVKDELRSHLSATSGAIVGSVPYMAPEQILGPKSAVGPAIDIYALGVILYRMLTGGMPFPGFSTEALIRKIVHDQPDSVRSRRGSVPVDLETICEKCLRKKPHRRFESAADLRDDLMRLLRGERILSRPTPSWEKAMIWSKKYPTASVAGLSAITIIGLLWNQNHELRRMNSKVELSASVAQEHAIRSDENLKLANDRNRLVERFYYDRRLLDAQAAIADRNDLLAQQILREIDPGPENREFVWNHLWRKSREKLEFIPISDRSADLGAIMSPGSGRWLVSVTHSHDILIIDTLTWKVDRIDCKGSAHWNWGVATSPDETRIRIAYMQPCDAADCNDAMGMRAIEWDTVTKTIVSDNRFDSIGSELRFAFRPGSDLCLVKATFEPAEKGGARTYGVYSFDFRSGDLSRMNLPERLGRMCISPDGRSLAAAREPGELFVWNTEDFERSIRIRTPYEELPKDISFFENGAKVAAIAPDGTRVHSWPLNFEARDGAAPDSVLTVSEGVLDYLWPLKSPLRLVAAGDRGRLALLEPGAGRMADFAFDPADPEADLEAEFQRDARFVEFDGSIYANAYRNDRGTNKDRLFVLNLESMRQIPMSDSLRQASIWPSSDLKHLYGNNLRQLFEWWPNRTYTIPDGLTGHRDEVWCAAFTPDSQILVTGSNDTDESQTLKAWRREAGKPLWSIHAHAATVSAMAMHPGGGLVATGALCEAGNVRLWDTDTGQMKAELDGLDRGVRSLKFSPDGRLLAGGDKKGGCVVWDVASGEGLHALPAGTDRVLDLAFSGEGRILNTGSEDGWMRAWNLATGKKVLEFFVGRFTTGLAFGPEAKIMAIIGYDGRIQLWDFEAGEPLRNFEMPGLQPWAITIFPDGKTLAAGDKLGKLMMWDLETGTEKFRVKAHDAQINALTLSPDGQTLVSCAHDGTVRLWHAGPEN